LLFNIIITDVKLEWSFNYNIFYVVLIYIHVML